VGERSENESSHCDAHSDLRQGSRTVAKPGCEHPRRFPVPISRGTRSLPKTQRIRHAGTFALPWHWFTDSFACSGSRIRAVRGSIRRLQFAGIDALKTRVHVDAASAVDIRTRPGHLPKAPSHLTCQPFASRFRPCRHSRSTVCSTARDKAPGSPPGSNPSSISMEPFASSVGAGNRSGRSLPNPEPQNRPTTKKRHSTRKTEHPFESAI